MKSPFKFLDPFGLDDKAVFFGRKKETDTLYRMVYQSNLILIYGYSGTGKTSLIQCGLAGRFDGPQWHPFYIRKGEDINVATRSALGKALEEELPEDVTLTELVEAIREEYLSPVYLIFDQFEELFILGRPEEQAQFARDIQALLDADLDCKVIFVLREEYLGELYQLERALPKLFDFKLRVEAMNNLKVKEVLRSSFSAFNIGLETPVEDRLEEIIENVGLKKAGIQLPYLQVYLDQLYREDYARTYPEGTAAETGTPTHWPTLEFTRAEINAFGTMAEVFPRFLEGQKEKIQQELAQKYPKAKIEADTIRNVLDEFVTEEGTKRPIPFQLQDEQLDIPERILKKMPLRNPLLTDCLKALENSRILRVREGSYELAHDSLAALIDEQRTDEQRQHNEIKVRLASNYLEWQRTGEYLTRKQLISVESFLDRLTLAPHLQQFVADSKAFNQAQEEAERQKQQAELEKERQLRGTAEANAQQSRQRTRIAVSLALLSAIALFVAIQQFGQAKTARDLALKDRKSAVASRDSTLNALALADSLSQKAEQERLAAVASRDSTRGALALADSLGKRAVAAATSAEQALAQLRATTTQLLDSTLSDAQRDILALNYDAALVKYQNAAQLEIRPEKVATALMEIAFFRAEAGQYKSAWTLSKQTAKLFNRPFRPSLSSPPDSLQALRNALNELDADRYQQLEARYFPTMVDVPGGTFWMGCDTLVDDCNPNELPRHEVALPNFRMARTETTVWQYYLCTEASEQQMPATPSWQWSGDNPVVSISWYDALAYANWLSRQRGQGVVYQLEIPANPNDLYEQEGSINWNNSVNWEATGFRLPTEAEWEYAARGGQQSQGHIYSGSNELDEVAWWGANASSRTQSVARKKANELGLYDMSGNVWEWCWDWYAEDYYTNDGGVINDPKGPISGSSRVLRGGSWNLNYRRICVVTLRYRDFPNVRHYVNGFRLAQD